MLSKGNPSKSKPIVELFHVIEDSKVVVVADIETSGLSPKCASEIIEIGAVVLDVESGKILEANGKKLVFKEFLALTKKPRLPPGITKLTGITDEDLKCADQPENVLARFYDFIGTYPIVFHNASFDWDRFFIYYFEQIGKRASNDIICTLRLARYLHPNFERHGLAELCEKFGHPMVGHHRAWVDSKYTGSLYITMRKELLAHLAQEKLEPSLLGLLNGEHPKHEALTTQTADKKDIKVFRINYWEKGRSCRRIYVTTNVANSYYDLIRGTWVVSELRTEKTLDMQVYADTILESVGLTLDQFIQKFSPAA